ncbi:MAG: Ig-like domain-containing protein, partial [Eubacterium sp.]|nr:Ig-like domain-containing protein [Eubacterium sp.]
MRKMTRIRFLVALFLISGIAMIQPLYTEAADSVVVTEYRVRVRDASDFEYQSTTIKGSLGSDWEYIDYDTTTTYGEWEAWSGWSRTAYTKSETMDVESRTIPATYKTQYHYSRYIGQSSSSGYWYTYPWATGICQSYDETAWLDSPLPEEWDGEFYGYGRGYDTYGNFQYRGNGQRWDIWWYNPETRQVVATNAYTEYRYRTRTKTVTTTYNYRRAVWGDWSDWKEESEWNPDDIVPSSTRQVQSREKEKGIKIDETVFKDDKFREYVINFIDIDTDGYLKQEEIDNVLEIDVNNMEISSLKGIEVFSKLQNLYCNNNLLQITKESSEDFDLSQNTMLINLSCAENDIAYLDLSSNIKLRVLKCGMNELVELNLANNTALTTLSCEMNKIQSLVFGSTLITSITCDDNYIKNLDLSKLKMLSALEADNNQIEVLDLSANTKLATLFCNNNKLTELDLRYNPNLSIASCEDNNITLVDFRNTRIRTPGLGPTDEGTFAVYSDDDLGWVSSEEDTYYLVDDGVTPYSCHFATGWTVVEEEGKEYLFKESDTVFKDETLKEKYESKPNGVLVSEATRLKKVLFDSSSITVREWDKKTLNVITTPANLEDDLIWTSSDESVLSVDENGQIHAHKSGTAYVTVESMWDGGDSNMVEVTVKPALEFTSDTISNNNWLLMDYYENQEMNVPYEIKITCGDNVKSTTWDILYRDHDSISMEGEGNSRLITAMGVGIPQIQISVNGQEPDEKKDFFVNVLSESEFKWYMDIVDFQVYYKDQPVDDDTVLALTEGDEAYIEIHARDSKGNEFILNKTNPTDSIKDESTQSTKALKIVPSWSSTGDEISVSDCVITAEEPGEGSLTISLRGYSDIQQTIAYKISKKPNPTSAILFSEESISLEVGKNLYLRNRHEYNILPADADDQNDIVFRSLNPGVASIDSSQKIVALKAGTAIIRAESVNNSFVYADLKVVVHPVYVKDITLEQGVVKNGVFTSKGTVSEGQEIQFYNMPGEELYIRCKVNEDAGEKDLNCFLKQESEDDLVYIQDVSLSVGTGDEQIFRLTPLASGSTDVYFTANDEGGVYTYFTLRLLPADGWIRDEDTGKMIHFSGGSRDYGWKQIDGNTYYFNPEDNYMMTGWQKISGNWYYFGNNGVMRTGWKDI